MLPQHFFPVTSHGFCCVCGQDTGLASPAAGGGIQLQGAWEDAATSTTRPVFRVEAAAPGLTELISGPAPDIIITTNAGVIHDGVVNSAVLLLRNAFAPTLQSSTTGE